jgi:hypothetical protein
MQIKNAEGHFTYLSKVIAMIAGAVTLLIALGGAAFTIDERHAHVIEVAGQFKSIDDSRQMDNLQNALVLTQIRMDILEDRLLRELTKEVPSDSYIRKLESDLRKLEKQFEQINEKLLGQ